MTDMYLTAVEDAVADPGRWIVLPRRFSTEFNASITGYCLREGYLRVQPRKGDTPVSVQGKRYIRTAAPVASKADRDGDEWRLSVRFDV